MFGRPFVEVEARGRMLEGEREEDGHWMLLKGELEGSFGVEERRTCVRHGVAKGDKETSAGQLETAAAASPMKPVGQYQTISQSE